MTSGKMAVPCFTQIPCCTLVFSGEPLQKETMEAHTWKRVNLQFLWGVTGSSSQCRYPGKLPE